MFRRAAPTIIGSLLSVGLISLKGGLVIFVYCWMFCICFPSLWPGVCPLYCWCSYIWTREAALFESASGVVFYTAYRLHSVGSQLHCTALHCRLKCFCPVWSPHCGHSAIALQAWMFLCSANTVYGRSRTLESVSGSVNLKPPLYYLIPPACTGTYKHSVWNVSSMFSVRLVKAQQAEIQWFIISLGASTAWTLQADSSKQEPMPKRLLLGSDA